MRQIIMTHKNLTAVVRLAVMAGLGVATGALAVDLTKLPPASTQTGVTYAKDIQPIFKASCFDCHGDQARPKHGLRLDSLAAALKGSQDGEVIVPGKSDKSDLVINICWEAKPEHPMPPNPPARRGGPDGTGAPGAGNQPPPGPGGPGPAAAPRKELTPEQIGLIRAWIDQGAK
jgi:mono/diheme cytochrome c family protein